MNMVQQMMMKTPGFISCRELDEKLDDYVEGDLSLLNKVRFSMHFAACQACKAYVAGYRKAVDLIKRSIIGDNAPAADEAVPEELVQDILNEQARAKPDQ